MTVIKEEDVYKKNSSCTVGGAGGGPAGTGFYQEHAFPEKEESVSSYTRAEHQQQQQQQHHHHGHGHGHGRIFPWNEMISHLFFVLASILYMNVAIIDLNWSRTLQDLPMYVRTATDDAVWLNYRLEERYNASLVAENQAADRAAAVAAAAAEGGVRRWLQFQDYVFVGDLQEEDGDDVSTTEIPVQEVEEEDEEGEEVADETVLNSTIANAAQGTTKATSAELAAADMEESSQLSSPITPEPTAPPKISSSEAPADPLPSVTGETNAQTEPSVTTSAPTTVVTSSLMTPAELYHDEWWADLPADIQAAYAILGYNENSWNQGIPSEVDDLGWNELSPEQQAAATFIGYTQQDWDGTEAPTTTDVIGDGGGDVVATATSTAIVNAAASNTNTNTNTNTNSTSSFSSSNATTTVPSPPPLDTTNNASTTTATITTTITRFPPEYWFNFFWKNLPPEIQEVWSILGYNEDLWNSGGESKFADYWWRELPPPQQQAAASIGYNEEKWDGSTTDGGDGGADGDTTDAVEADFVSYDDDYLFQVGDTDTWVSKYQVLYFFAALSFVFVGILDLIRTKEMKHIVMILAGISGVVSAILVEVDVYTSNVMNSISVHGYLLEGLWVVADVGNILRNAVGDSVTRGEQIMLFAGSLFVTGAFLDVIVSTCVVWY